ncbi:MAG: glycosyltransferase [Thiotrichaceae bacterium]
MLTASIVIPTRNEESNIKALLTQIKPYGYEAIVVDDSDDETPEIARKMGAKVVKGKRKGLGQAIVDGINASGKDVVLVMDSDLSHSPADIPRLLKPILEQGADFVIASRYIKGGDVSDWNFNRRIQSLIGVKLMQLVTRVSDSNSGFFALRKSILEGVELKPQSWKIMLEVLFKGNWVYKTEVPIKFGDRQGGVSKNSVKERLVHAAHILKLLVWKFRRYITFACVGGIGALWYFGILYFLTEYVDIWYGFSAIIGTFVAITNNYLINHHYTFRKDKHINKNLFRGWLKYVGNSAIGDGADWCALILMTEVFGLWYMLSAFIASGVASVLKYTIAKKFIWGKKGRTCDSEDYEWNAFFKGLPWQKRWKQLLARIVKEFAEYPSGNAGRLLDVGSGSSPQGVLINHSDYIGIDPAKNKIEYMQGKKMENCLFVHGTMDLVTFTEKEYFDTVLFVEVIEHLEGMHEAVLTLSAINGSLKMGGKLIVATPNFGGFFGKAMDRLYGLFQKNAYAEQHQLKFDLATLIALCEETGFDYVKSEIPSGADMVCLFEKVGYGS